MRASTHEPQNFVVVAPTRSGSSWLMDRINNVPGTEGHMELFYHLPRREPPRAGCNDYERFVEIGHRFGKPRPLAVFRYLDALYARPAAVGFKLMYPHLRDYPELLVYLMRRRIAVVHLVRSNHLDVVLSENLAGRTGRFHATRGEKVERNASITLDPAVVARRVRWLDRKQRIVRGLLRLQPNPVHEVSYESLCQEDEAFLSMCRFLGVPGEQEDRSKSRLIKTQQQPHSSIISNFDEVQSALEIAGYRHLLH